MMPKKQVIVIRTEGVRDFAAKRVASLPILDKPLEVVIRPHKRNRSLEQNDLYWLWMTIIGDSMGYSKDAIHREVMEMFLRPKILDTPSGPKEEYSTKELGVKEFSEYLDKISAFAADFGIRLPSLQDMGYDQ